MKATNLNGLRDKIDRCDAQIVHLLNQRAALASEIGKVKSRSKTGPYDPARERAIIKNIADLNRGPLSASSLASIYREIMSASLALEKNVVVAYMGPPSSFSHQAALRRFGASVKYLDCDTIDYVFERVQKREADYGVVPIENLIEGAIANTLDRLAETDLKICAEIYQPIEHYLLASGPRKAIRRVATNPYVFGQCRRWLKNEMPDIELVPVTSTARAAEMASRDKHTAAIASKFAAQIYKLKMLGKDIQDISGNITRFLVIGNSFSKRTGHDKTSLLFSLKHRSGSLHRALGALKKYRLNMTKIESRPNRLKAWEYLFFVDIEGHVEDAKVSRALRELDRHCQLMTILGSYPKATE